MAAKHGTEIPFPRNRFYALGAEALYGRLSHKAPWMMLRDNW